MMTRAEADARFAAMLERDDAKRAQHLAEINARFVGFFSASWATR